MFRTIFFISVVLLILGTALWYEYIGPWWTERQAFKRRKAAVIKEFIEVHRELEWAVNNPIGRPRPKEEEKEEKKPWWKQIKFKWYGGRR